MSDIQSLKTVRIFVASPSDMAIERDCLAKVVKRLNDSMARELGLMLDFTDWSSHVRPAMGSRPEEVILDQIPVDTWDIFIGLLWMKFGSPTGAHDPATGVVFSSGTHEEFTLAYRCWQKAKKPTIMFYRCTRVPAALTDIDPAHLNQINQFFDGFGPRKDTPGLFKTFRETDEFEAQVNKHLSALLFEASRVARASSPMVQVSPPAQTSPFVANQAYEVVAVSVDIVKHSDIVRRNAAEAKAVLAWFEQFVMRIFAGTQWQNITWTPDGGIFITAQEDMYNRSALIGMRLLKELELHNLDPANNVKLAIRVAAADGPLVWDDNRSRISAEVLNFTKHLEASGTEPGEFCIADTVHRQLHETLRAEFRIKPRFGGRRVLGYRSVSSSGPPSREYVDHLVQNTIGHLNEQAQRQSTVEPAEVSQDAMSVVDSIYRQLDTFSRYFPALDERWSLGYIKAVDAWTGALLDAEKEYWTTVQASYTRAADGSLEQEHWTSVAEIVGSKRTGVVLPLARLKAKTEVRLLRGEQPEPRVGESTSAVERSIDTLTAAPLSAEFEKKIRRLLESDELQEEELFADVMTNERAPLMAAISSPEALRDVRKEFLDRLWMLSDLILIEELLDRRAGVFNCLLKAPATRTRYNVLMQLLRGETAPTEEIVRAKFEGAGLPFTPADLHVVWRTAIVGMPSMERRVAAMSVIPLELLWRTIAAPHIQVSALWAVAQRFKNESEDMNKIFFDCVHARLMREVQTMGSEFAVVSKLLSHFFAQTLFVQSPYFERLDDLLLNFRSASANKNVAVDLFDKVTVKLKQIREDLGNPQANVPTGIGALPLPVQRHLASEGLYIDSFVLHPDSRIALETLPFITIANVERLMRYRQLNEMLFHQLQTKREFFVKATTVMDVLQHPKCSTEFAKAYLPKVAESNIRKVMDNPTANQAVRELAKRLLAFRSSSASRSH